MTAHFEIFQYFSDFREPGGRSAHSASVSRSGLTVLFDEVLRGGVEPTGEIGYLRSNTIAGFTSLPAVAVRVPG